MDAIGINIYSLGIYTILFVIIFVLLQRLLLPSLRKNIEIRKQQIQKNRNRESELEALEKKLTQQSKEHEKEVLHNALAKSDELTNQAEQDAEKIISEAKKKAKNILEDAKASVEAKEKSLEESFEKRVKEKALEIVNKYYADNSKSINEKELEKYAKEIN